MLDNTSFGLFVSGEFDDGVLEVRGAETIRWVKLHDVCIARPLHLLHLYFSWIPSNVTFGWP